MNKSDINELKNRDEAALYAFFEQLSPGVKRVVEHALKYRHPVDVEEVVDEVFSRIFSRLDDLTKFEDTDKLAAYCLKVARNVALEYSIRFKKEDAQLKLYESQLDAVDSRTPEALLETKEQQVALSKALAALPGIDREVLEMWVSGKNLKEISTSLGLSVSTTHRVLKVAQQRLVSSLRVSSKRLDKT
jgi:RNA polymerase sigma factor (sigma-70 family)